MVANKSYSQLGNLKFRSLSENELTESEVGELYCDTRGFWGDVTTIWVCIEKTDIIAVYKYVAGWMPHETKIAFPLTKKMYNVYIS